MNMTMIARTVALVSSLERARVDQARRLEELFEGHHQRLYRLARRLSATHEDARDLVQETYLRAARKPGSVPVGASSEEAWLVRVLINLSRDRWRQQAVRRRVAPADYADPSTTPSCEAALIARTTIWRALQLLPPRDSRHVRARRAVDSIRRPNIGRERSDREMALVERTPRAGKSHRDAGSVEP
jgi:RNA polymerase sigma factor (sigma-70 family)